MTDARIRPTLLATVLLVATFAARYMSAAGSPGIDFFRAWAASRLDVGDVYSRGAHERLYQLTVPPPGSEDSGSRVQVAAAAAAAADLPVLGYRGVDVVHTPLLLAVFHVLRTDDYEHDYRLYLFASLACFLAAAFGLGRLVGFSTPMSLAIASALAFLLDAEISELQVGNVNNFQVAAVAAFLVLQRRARPWADVASGAVLALAIAFKPNLALVGVGVALAWMGDRRWRTLARAGAGAALGLALAVAVSPALVPGATWRGWLAIVPILVDSAQPFWLGNFSLAAVVAKTAGLDVSRVVLGAGAAALVAASLRPLWSRSPSAADRTLAAVAAGSALMVLSSRLVWIHYVVLTLPALILAARACATGAGPWAWASAAALLALAGGVMTALRTVDGSLVLAAAAMNLSLLALFAVAVAALWRPAALAT